MTTSCVAHVLIFQLELERTLNRKLCDGPTAAASSFYHYLADAIH